MTQRKVQEPPLRVRPRDTRNLLLTEGTDCANGLRRNRIQQR
eukprot:CAMPEP_0197927716 /NCGR_PEP_ID=MMETSP1439-20131203/101138_1 /TAXON_ID=66791 /ORGANISM="Gonyaulax spinifera, Strain CCMP409" /LENGTH=41 /DNA_ID= /DNA_START= /DNA_END= /DNA_ORIENTATION=